MLIDSNTVLREGAARTTGAGEAIALTSFTKPGKQNPIPFCIKVTEDYTGGTSMTFALQQADLRNGAFSEVKGFSLTVPTADLKKGTMLPVRYLPRDITKPWIRLSYVAEGSFSTGSVFAYVGREVEEPYEEGMYIKDGKVVG